MNERPRFTIEELYVEGWRSIAKTDPPIRLGNLNVLIGANGAGKSSLVLLFKLLAALPRQKLQEFVAKNGGANSLVHFGVKHTDRILSLLSYRYTDDKAYRLELRLNVSPPEGLLIDDVRVFTRVGGAEAVDGWTDGTAQPELTMYRSNDGGTETWNVLRILSHSRAFHFVDTSPTSPMRQGVYIERNGELDTDGGNLAAMLYLYKQKYPVAYNRIRAAVRNIAANFDDFVLEPQRLNPNNILLNWRARGSDYPFGPHQLSDGTLRAMALCTLLLQPEEDFPSLLVIDEPELGLHPSAVSILVDLLHLAAKSCQVIVATQSPSLLDHFSADDVIVANTRNGASSFERLSAKDLKQWYKKYALSDLWERNVIGGGPYG